MKYSWTPLTHPTKYPVKDNGRVVIPVGTPNVEVAYGQSSKPLLGKNQKPTGKMQNAYRWNGVVYNA